MTYIPDDIIYHILEYVPIPCSVERVSSSFRQMSRMIWDKEVREVISSRPYLTLKEAMGKVATRRTGRTIVIKETWLEILLCPYVGPFVITFMLLMVLYTCILIDMVHRASKCSNIHCPSYTP